MKFYDVAKDYIERMEYLEQGINAETGEMSDDGTQLAIWTAELTQDLKDKSANVIAVVRNQELTIEALDNEIERLEANDLATKELRKLYHQVLKGLYRAKTIRENTDNDDIYSEFLLYDEDGNLIEETNVTSFESREIIKLLINSYENQLLKVGGKIRKPNKEVR